MTERTKSQDPHWPVKSDSHWILPAQGLQKIVQVGPPHSPEQYILSHCSTHMWAFSACSSFPCTSPAIVDFLPSHTNCIFFLAFSLPFPFCHLSSECSFIYFQVLFPLFRMLWSILLYFICCTYVASWVILMSSPVPLAIVLPAHSYLSKDSSINFSSVSAHSRNHLGLVWPSTGDTPPPPLYNCLKEN